MVLGDGEIQEGQIWEAAMFGAYHKVDNVCAIVDYNRIQLDGFVKDIMELEPLADKWRAFGWAVRAIDGHSMREVVSTLRSVPFEAGKPSMIVSNTIKGKGVSFMENQAGWHGKAPGTEETRQALAELEA